MSKPTVSDIDNKWKSVTGPSSPDDPTDTGLTGHAAEICAWSLEAEARFLRNDDLKSTVGTGLKYVFPAIRRTIEALTADNTVLNDEISPGVVLEVTVESVGVILGTARELESEKDHPDLEQLDKEQQALMSAGFAHRLAERIHASIVSFPG